MKILVLTAALVLAGCATTSGLQATVNQSGFDGSRVVNMPAHGNACSTLVCTGIGAQWSSKNPGDVILTAQLFNDIKGILAAKVSVNGVVTELKPNQAFTNFDTKTPAIKISRRDFVVPLSLVRQIAAADKAWLRINTTDGYVEDAVIDGGKDSKALHALRRFLAAVDGA